MSSYIEATVKVAIPEEYVLITQVEYEQLRNSEQKGEIGDMKCFKSLVNISNDTAIREKVLYPYRSELELFIKYPENGLHWQFHKNHTREWVESNFDKANRSWGK